MNIQLVRYATLLIKLDDGRTLLIDPMLGDVGEFDPFTPSCSEQANPLVSLPAGLENLSSTLSPENAAVFVTHTHLDHFDQAAVDQLPKDLPIFCQPTGKDQSADETDEAKLSKTFGFSSVQPVEDNLQSDGIDVFRTDGEHGPSNEDGRGGNMGPVSGFLLHSQNEPTLYIAGDTIWCPEKEATQDRRQPVSIRGRRLAALSLFSRKEKHE